MNNLLIVPKSAAFSSVVPQQKKNLQIFLFFAELLEKHLRHSNCQQQKQEISSIKNIEND